jgi:predicted MFS family arabinose efflux permease
MFGCLLILPTMGAAGVGGLSLLAFAALLFQAPQQKWLVQRVPHASGLALALNASAAYIGMAVGAATGSAAYACYGPGALPILSLGYLVLALLILAGAARGSHSSARVTER